MLLFEVTALVANRHIGDFRGNGQSHNYKAELPIAWLSLKSCLAFDRWEPNEVSIGKPKKRGAKSCTQEAMRKLMLTTTKPSL